MASGSTNQPAIDYSLLKNRTCIVTGGASGLGAAIAERFANNGAYVTIADVTEDNGKALASKLTSQGKHASFVKCDTTNWTSSVAAFKHAVNFGVSKTLDVAALFAGVGGEGAGLVDIVSKHPEPTLEGDPGPEPTHKAIDVNLHGVYLSTWLSLHYFRLPSATAEGRLKKSLVMVSSLGAYIDFSYNSGYGTSKFGVRGLYRSIRGPAHELNVRVNCLAPGYILTPLTKEIHGIESPDQVSKKAGIVLPWAPLEWVVEAAARCAVDDGVDGECD